MKLFLYRTITEGSNRLMRANAFLTTTFGGDPQPVVAFEADGPPFVGPSGASHVRINGDMMDAAHLLHAFRNQLLPYEVVDEDGAASLGIPIPIRMVENTEA